MCKLKSLSVLVISFVFFGFTLLAANDFSGGNGSVENPYQITTAQQLNLVRNYLDSNFVLNNNIDLSSFSEGLGWEPLGFFVNFQSEENQPFTGIFDGQGYTISNLTITNPDGGGGLFGFLHNGTIRNVKLENVNVNVGVNGASSLLIIKISGIVENCSASGVVNGVDYVGGLIGVDFGGGVYSSSSSVSVSGSYVVGGLIGNLDGSGDVIYNCFSTGNVVGEERVGGLIGYNNGIEVSYSFTTGDITGYNEIGGLIGYAKGDDPINRCYTTGTITGESYVGGLIGFAEVDVLITNSYTHGNVYGKSMVGGLVGILADISEIRYSYATGDVIGTNSEGDYNIGGLVGYCTESSIKYSYATGNVNPDIYPYEHVGGLVGLLTFNSSIENSFASGHVAGDNRVAGLAGQLSFNCSISNSFAMGNVSGISFVGGLIGNFHIGTVTNSFSTGTVAGNNHSGGLIGNIGAGTTADIANSYWNLTTSGQDNSQGGYGRTTEQMTFPYSADTYVGWDFEEIWIQDNDFELNSGYPFLRNLYDAVSVEENIYPTIKIINAYNYPNPFNPSTKISFTLPSEFSGKDVFIDIYNVKGQRIKSYQTRFVIDKENFILWDGTNTDNKAMSSGVYLYRINSGKVHHTGKMIMLK